MNITRNPILISPIIVVIKSNTFSDMIIYAYCKINHDTFTYTYFVISSLFIKINNKN